MPPHDADLKPSPETESPSPEDAAGYVKAGLGTWQPLGLVLQRINGRLLVDDVEAG